MNGRLIKYVLALLCSGLPLIAGAVIEPGSSDIRLKHREGRLREAVRQGDLTPEEAEQLRQHLRELRRERLERLRESRRNTVASDAKGESADSPASPGKLLPLSTRPPRATGHQN
jgi:hypothetical protein